MNTDVSIIIPLYNKEKCIKATIQSIQKQTYTNFEILVVDDGSTDGSANIVKAIIDERIRYIYKSNGGVSSARNMGIDEAKNDWILFLDADDQLDERCLEVLCKPLEENSKIDISTAKFYVEKKGHKSISTNCSFTGIISNNYKWLFLNKYNLRTGCCIIRKEILESNKFDEKLSRFEDMKSILDWIRYARIYVSSESVMTYQTDNSSLSRISKDMSKDFIFNMSFKHKSFWEKCILGKLLYLGWIGYQQEHKVLRKLYGKRIFYMYIAKFQLLLSHF